MYTDQNRLRRFQSGLTMIELIISIVIVSVAIAGVLGVLSYTTSKSADPQVRKQAVAIAEALLEEVELMPFTNCDPDFYDSIAGVCNAGGAEAMGPEAGEARGSAVSPFDNVNDYNGLILAPGANDLNNAGTVTIPAGYSASVAVTPTADLGAGNTLLITVTVNYGGDSIVLEGYRTKYAPNPT